MQRKSTSGARTPETLPCDCTGHILRFLIVSDRAQVAACSGALASAVTDFYTKVRIGQNNGGQDTGGDNVCDLSNVQLTATRLKQLIEGTLVESGRWCKPTALTFDWLKREVETDWPDLPEWLNDVLAHALRLSGKRHICCKFVVDANVHACMLFTGHQTPQILIHDRRCLDPLENATIDVSGRG